MIEPTKIYYFSGTGNSLSIAKNLQAKLMNAELISITQLMKTPGDIIIEGEVIGFVFPVHFFRVPVVVSEFIERTVFGKTAYIFAIANGGGGYCRTLKIFNKQLKRKKRSLNAGFTIGMPGIHPKIYKMMKKTSKEYFEEKKKQVVEISEIILNKKNHYIQTNFGLFGFLLSYIFLRKTYNDSKKHLLDAAIQVEDNCNQCGVCKKHCPVDNIELTSSGPKRQGKCLNCARCFHICHNDAIKLGGDTMPRYINPEIELRELV